jgi:CheY-like chemotaxis protein
MPTKSKIRILVVEDDSTVRLTISKLLGEEGYDVSTATDGFDALLHLQQAIPDLLLSDLNMPQMSGFELLSVVRRRFPEILVVASSGRTIPILYLTESYLTLSTPKVKKVRLSSWKLLPVWSELVRQAIGEKALRSGFPEMVW